MFFYIERRLNELAAYVLSVRLQGLCADPFFLFLLLVKLKQEVKTGNREFGRDGHYIQIVDGNPALAETVFQAQVRNAVEVLHPVKALFGDIRDELPVSNQGDAAVMADVNTQNIHLIVDPSH